MKPFLCPPTSTRMATSILEAWGSGDIGRLRAELDRTAGVCSVPGRTTFESERRELLGGIVEDLAGSLTASEGVEAAGMAADLSVLLHLTQGRPSL